MRTPVTSARTSPSTAATAATSATSELPTKPHHSRSSSTNPQPSCGAEGHFSRDCPEPRKEGTNSGLCYNCNEPGHNKADCPNPAVEREFTGECRGCGKTGHRKADCPEKGPELCRACKKEGHVAADCEANRLFTLNGVGDVGSPEETWAALKEADAEKESVAIKKVCTYVD